MMVRFLMSYLPSWKDRSSPGASSGGVLCGNRRRRASVGKRSRAHECPLRRETCANSLDNLSSGWDDAKCCESSTVDDGLTIDEHLVLTISAVNHVDIDPQVTSQLRCHTGGVQTRQSVRAVSNNNPSHFELLVTSQPSVASA